MAQIRQILRQGEELGLRLVAGPAAGADITGVAIAPLGRLDAPPGSLVIVTTRGGEPPSSYQIDIALHEAIARGFGALAFAGSVPVPATARKLAAGGAMPLLLAETASASELAMALDRIIRGGAVEALARAERAIEAASAAAAEGVARPREAILMAASHALGVNLDIEDDPAVKWTDRDAVCIGEVPIGRLAPARADEGAAVAVPVVAAVLSRALQREWDERFAPTLSRADLIVELVLAESSRVDGFSAEAVRLGLPLQLSHVVGWLRPTYRPEPGRRPPRSVEAAVELFALQLTEPRPELWHVATIHDDIILVSTEPDGSGDHQRRLRLVGEAVAAHAALVAGEGWVYTVGLGAPWLGAAGLRQSAAEARIAAEAAIAAGRAGSVEVTDVTGLRRVLIDFYASPLSRRLLDDILAPLDALGSERAEVAIRTLLAYVANKNSLARAAEALNLHPNAVNYRIRRAEKVLALDLDNPDERFAVELACRVRLLSSRRR